MKEDLRELPYSLAELIKKYLNMEKPLIRSIKKEGAMVKFVDTSEGSNFYFEITGIRKNNSRNIIISSRKPANLANPQVANVSMNPDQLNSAFSSWYEVIKKYRLLLNSDGISETEFQGIVGELQMDIGQEDNRQLSIKEQLTIDKFLENSIELVENLEVPDSLKTYQVNLLEDIRDIKLNQGLLTKYQVRKRLVILIGKGRKLGANFLIGFFRLLKEEAPKWLIKHGLDSLAG